jgi:ABC-type uncharacterized transport system permease subunit
MNKFFNYNNHLDFWLFGFFVGFLFLNRTVMITTIMLSYIIYTIMFKYIYPRVDNA